MRISATDIQRAISGLLADNGFTVLPPESAEGGVKPYCCVEVLPTECERLNGYIENDTYSAGVVYIPRQETQVELLSAADKLRIILLYKPLEVNDRIIDTESVTFSKNDTGNVLIAAMSYEFEQETGYGYDDDEPMQILDAVSNIRETE